MDEYGLRDNQALGFPEHGRIGRRLPSSSGSTFPRRPLYRLSPGPRRARSDAVVAYLSDFVVVNGPADLFRQERGIAADPRASSLAARYVDSGRPGNPTRMGEALRRLIRDARAGRYRAVIVETILRLGPDLATALQAALALVEAGVEIFETCGDDVEITPELASYIDRCDPCAS